MRIAILTHGRVPFGALHARAFQTLGHEVHLLSLSPCEATGSPVPVRLVGPADFRPWETASRWSYLRAIGPVRRTVREIAPDILFAIYLSSAGVIACLSGHRRVVVSAQGSDVSTRVGSFFWRQVFQWEFARATLIHAVSEPRALLVGPCRTESAFRGRAPPASSITICTA
ncbi:MAG: glycosyltransferase [Phycisphaerae bacterium]